MVGHDILGFRDVSKRIDYSLGVLPASGLRVRKSGKPKENWIRRMSLKSLFVQFNRFCMASGLNIDLAQCPAVCNSTTGATGCLFNLGYRNQNVI